MKFFLSRQVYDQLDTESKRRMLEHVCECVTDHGPSPDCENCDGKGTIYEMVLPANTAAAIQDNLRRQGVPITSSDPEESSGSTSRH